MSIVISPIPNSDKFDVWINSTKLIMTRTELIALNATLIETLRITK